MVLWVSHPDAKHRRDFLHTEAPRLHYALNWKKWVLNISLTLFYFSWWLHQLLCIHFLCVWPLWFVNAAYVLENFLVSCGDPLNSDSRVNGFLKLYSKHPPVLKQSLGYHLYCSVDSSLLLSPQWSTLLIFSQGTIYGRSMDVSWEICLKARASSEVKCFLFKEERDIISFLF